MTLIGLVVVLIVVGVLLWLFNKYVKTIDPTIKQIINWVVIIAVILYVLAAFGVFSALYAPLPRIGRP